MLTEIKEINNKSWNNYSSGSNFFKKRNAIYAMNGCGKSSLATELSKQAGFTEDRYRLFNTKYINDCFVISEDENGVKGVKASFGLKNNDIHIKISELREEIVDTKELEKEIEITEKSIKENINVIHDEKKGDANISKKSASYPVEKILELYRSDLDDALKIAEKNELRSTGGDTSKLENEKIRIQSIQIPTLPSLELNRAYLISVERVMAESINNSHIPESKILDWIRQGIGIHSEADDLCQFCHGKMNISEVSNRFNEYVEDESQKKRKILEEYLESQERDIEKIKHTISCLTSINEESLVVFLDKIPEISEGLLEVSSKNDLVNEKIRDLNKIFELTFCDTEDIGKDIQSILDNLQKENQNKIKELDLSINNISKIAKGAIALSIQENPSLQQQINSHSELRRRLDAYKNKNDELNKKIIELSDSLNDYADFREFINDVLFSLGIKFKLIKNDLIDSLYSIVHADTDEPIGVGQISEGEKNLLALMFFYFELFNDNEQKNFKQEIELVVVDDPVSSLDGSNKFFVIEIVKQLFELKYPQIFIFTHAWDDFSDITYGKQTGDDSDYSFYEIRKRKDFGSEIIPIGSKKTPYAKLFEEIYELSKKDDTDSIDECDIYHSYNSMRRVFEEFLKFKSRGDLLPQRSNRDKIEQLVTEATSNKYIGKNRVQLAEFLDKINILSHRPGVSTNPITDAKFFMGLVERMDKLHYKSMTS